LLVDAAYGLSHAGAARKRSLSLGVFLFAEFQRLSHWGLPFKSGPGFHQHHGCTTCILPFQANHTFTSQMREAIP
jgi:hypothetical protein